MDGRYLSEDIEELYPLSIDINPGEIVGVEHIGAGSKECDVRREKRSARRSLAALCVMRAARG